MIAAPPPATARTSVRWRLRRWLAAPLPRRERPALLAAFVILLVLRLPTAWVRGRLLGEEGTIFFAYAWHRPAAEALWRSFGGYLNLAANATTLAAVRLVRSSVVPLEAAPWLTMATALAIQTVPALLLVTDPAPWLRRRGAMLAVLLALASMPMTEEVFANVLHIQFHLALAAGLVLALDVPRTAGRRLAYGAVLLVAPLCGPGAIVLVPFFLVRALLDRDRARAVQAAIFAGAAAIQLLVFFTPSPVRGQMLDPATLAAIGFVRLVALPFAGPWLARAIGTGIYHSWLANGPGWWLAGAAMLSYAGALVVAMIAAQRAAAAWLIASGLALAAVSFGGGMIATDASEWFNPGTGERYDFLPLVLVAIGLIVIAEGRGRGSGVARWLVGLTLFWGIAGFPFPIRAIDDGPPWPREVARWRRDHRHPLATWPQGKWLVDLSDGDRPCPPPDSGSSRTAPSYCEAAWWQHVADDAARVRAEARRTARP